MNFTTVKYVNPDETIVGALTTDGFYMSGSTSEGDASFLTALAAWQEAGNVIEPYVAPVVE